MMGSPSSFLGVTIATSTHRSNQPPLLRLLEFLPQSKLAGSWGWPLACTEWKIKNVWSYTSTTWFVITACSSQWNWWEVFRKRFLWSQKRLLSQIFH